MQSLSLAKLTYAYDTLQERLGGSGLLEAMTYANRQGALDEFLASLGAEDILDEVADPGRTRTLKVLVIGGSEINAGKMRSIARKAGIDPDRLEIQTDYAAIARFNFAKLRHNGTYAAVIVGPQPHSACGARGANSMIAEMESHPEIYPTVVRAMDSTGLKITNNSFKRAIEETIRLAA